MKLALYIRGKGGNADEAKTYENLFDGYDVVGFEYKALTPWEAKEEFPAFVAPLREKYNSIIIIANSIGAYFAMNSLVDMPIEKAFFISPIVDMEKLILDMMLWAGVSEEELRAKKEIPTSFGENLSWEYLSYVRAHPIEWRVPTAILYGENDNLTSHKTISEFAERTGASLTVMKNGEHWFHTEEQIEFLCDWIVEQTV
ncbi:MAG: alpha/beta hydrolase [Synergistaceae bacterium]|nr:alpha/beta hydrolase [Synergistaceae bacterium]